MKKIFALILSIVTLLSMAACGGTKTVHCDHCGKEVTISADSNMDEDWIIYCGECNEELFGDGLVS